MKENNVVSTNLEQKISLWQQLQSMVMEIENRNHSILNFNTVIPIILTVVAMLMNGEGKNTEEKFLALYILAPAMLLFAMFSGAFHNKYSAILRGYIAGLEETINQEIKENVFIWNTGYSELFHGNFFLTNDAVGILYFLVAVAVPVVCFSNLFRKTNNSVFVVFVLALYLAIYAAFLFIFVRDLLTNGRSKRYAKIYFYLHHAKDDQSWRQKFRPADIKKIEKAILKNKGENRNEREKSNRLSLYRQAVVEVLHR